MSSSENKAVFLSYASQDAEAALRICEALRAAGVEVWFDQRELRGGDAWDAKIRRQIAECALFVPVISANTQARLEGYFRVEWKLAAQRTHAMAEAKPFLLPLVIDDTRDADAHVPVEFRAVQWTRSAGDGPLAQFCARMQNLLNAEAGPRPSPDTFDSERKRATPKDGQESPVTGKARPRWTITAVGFVAMVVAVVGFIFYPHLRQSAADAKIESRAPATASLPATPSRVAGPKSLAVLPFKNLNGDSEGETYLLGICDELCTALGRIQGLRVVASSASFSFRDQTVSRAEIARQLGVGYLLEGSVQKIGNRIRIRAQLLRPPDVFPVWTSENLNHEVTDIFKLQDTIAGQLAQNLKLELGVTKTSSGRKVHPQAYELYLQAKEILERRSGADLTETERLLNQALKLDSQFAPAMVALEQTWHRQRYQPSIPTAFSLSSSRDAQKSEVQFIEKAEAQLRTALSIDPDLTDAYTELGLIFGRDFSTLNKAEPELLRAVRLNPSDGRAHQILAMVYNVHGDVDRSQAESALSAQLNTLSYGIANNHAWSLRESGRPHAALQFIERSPVAGEMWALVAHCLIDLGRTEEATNRIETMLREHARRGELSSMIAIFARLGQRARAEALLETIPRATRIDIGRLRGLAALGRRDEFVAMLKDGETSPILAARVLNDLEVFLMRGEPRFQAWLVEHGLAEAHARIVTWRIANPPETGVRR